MGHLSDPRDSRDQKCVGKDAGERSISHTRLGTKLQDMLRSDKPNLSYADFHHEITRASDDVIPKYVGGQQSQLLERVTPKEDELVRYMSNLPSYLEKGKDPEEKALNVGVLDWKLLEKWRYSQKQMGYNHNGYSPSSSNTSLFSTDGSSTLSSIGQSYSPAHQRTNRLTLQAPQGPSPKDGCIQAARSFSSRGHSRSPARQRIHNARLQSPPLKVPAGRGSLSEIDVFGGNSGKFQDSAVSVHNHLNRQQKVCSALPLCQKKESDLKLVSEGQRPTFDKYEAMAPWKGKTKIDGCESTEQTLKLQETKVEAADQDCIKREKSGVQIMPLDKSENSCSAAASSAFKVNALEVEKKTSGRSAFETSLPSKIVGNKHLVPTGTLKCPESIKNLSHASHVSLHSTKNKMFDSPYRSGAQGVKAPSQTPSMLSFPARMLSSPSRSRNTGEKKPFAGIGSTSIGKPSEDLDVGRSSYSIPRARNPSPIRRLGSAMSKMIKNAGSRDNSPVRRSSSKDFVAKSDSEGAVVSCSMDTSYRDKSSNNNNRGRSSPLRRLFDPLLRSRASNSPEPSKKQPSLTVGATKSCNDQLDFSAGHSAKAKSRSASCSMTSTSDSHHSSKNGSSSLQALLQVSFKNGFPLFTFAIDNESDILAATVRKLFVPGKGHHYWTYTFFTVREIKRKSGSWLNHGGRGDAHGYVPNVVAQMKVSDSLDCAFNKHADTTDDHFTFTREFNLFAVDVGHGDHSATDFHPTNELAAIVAKLPRISTEDPSKHGQSSYSWLDLSQASGGNLQETRCCARSDDDIQNHHSLGSLHVRTTVILPGGVHTVPSKGEMSTLAQRWRSGGSCDCGGWDLGCQLQVYANQRECERRIGSSATALSENKFRLFSLVPGAVGPQSLEHRDLGEVKIICDGDIYLGSPRSSSRVANSKVGQDKQPILSLKPFKERIYSVEFNSSLSLLQAFAVCISFLDCNRSAELSEPSHIVEKISDELGVFEVQTLTKSSDHQVSAPARYVSYPPHSPVGRV